MLDIRAHIDTDHILLTLTGRLDAAGQERFDREAAGLPARALPVVVDFTAVEFLSSAGLRSLIKAEKSLRPSGCGLVLCAMQPFVRQVLEVSGMQGLMRVVDDLESGLAQARAMARRSAGKHRVQGGGLASMLHPLEGGPSHLALWAAPGETPVRVSLEELGLALGIGGFGPTPEAALMGPALAAHRFACLAEPDSESCQADFLVTDQPAETHLFAKALVAVQGDPQAVLEPEQAATLGALADHALAVLDAEGTRPDPGLPLALAVWAGGLTLSGRESGSCGLILALAVGPDGPPPELKDLDWQPTEQGFLLARAVLLDGDVDQPESVESASLDRCLTSVASLETLALAGAAGPGAAIEAATVWAFAPTSLRSGEEGRMAVEVSGEPLPDEALAVTRRIFAALSGQGGDQTVARVVLTPLSGGFSSKNYSVESFDAGGRRLLPSVLKLGGHDLIRRELEAYEGYVKPFVLNNSTAVLGTARCGEWSGLAYNFLGVTGSQAKLTWLTNLYKARPAEELLPLFDRIFTDVLKPWYGQPRWEPFQPYKAHDPRPLFSALAQDAARELGVDLSSPTMDCPELGRDIRNPYHFLENQWTARLDDSRPWYTCVIHNDLNMQNILVDEKENAYIIDFSETGFGNAVADFARLEPIFLLEMTDLETGAQAAALARYMEGWYAAGDLRGVPEFAYDGDDPMVAKAHALMVRLREYADRVTIFETDLAPYLLAVLQWTLCVVSYCGFPALRMRMSAVMAGLAVEALERLE